jgi:hypothetical protein
LRKLRIQKQTKLIVYYYHYYCHYYCYFYYYLEGPPFFLLRLPTFDEIKKLASSGPLDKLVTKQNDTKIKVESDNSEDDSNTFTEEENSNIINEQNNTKDSEEANICAVDDLLCFSVEELLEDAQSMNQFFSLAQQRKTMDLFIKGQVGKIMKMINNSDKINLMKNFSNIF